MVVRAAVTRWANLALGDRPSIVLLRMGLNAVGAAWLLMVLARGWTLPGFDAISYWSIDVSDLYRWTETSSAAGPFRYSPVLGQLLDPLGVLPWGVFFSSFLAVSLVALVVLGGRWGLALLLVPSGVGEVCSATSTCSWPFRWVSAWSGRLRGRFCC